MDNYDYDSGYYEGYDGGYGDFNYDDAYVTETNDVSSSPPPNTTHQPDLPSTTSVHSNDYDLNEIDYDQTRHTTTSSIDTSNYAILMKNDIKSIILSDLEDLSDTTGLHIDECLQMLVHHKFNREKTLLDIIDNYDTISSNCATNTWSYRTQSMMNVINKTNTSYSTIPDLSYSEFQNSDPCPSNHSSLDAYSAYIKSVKSVLNICPHTNILKTSSPDISKSNTSELTHIHTGTCYVCFDSTVLVANPCGHLVCVECWAQLIHTHVFTGLGPLPPCVQESCQSGIALSVVEIVDAVCGAEDSVKYVPDTPENVENIKKTENDQKDKNETSSKKSSVSLNTSLLSSFCVLSSYWYKLAQSFLQSTTSFSPCPNSKCDYVLWKQTELYPSVRDILSLNNSNSNPNSLSTSLSFCHQHESKLPASVISEVRSETTSKSSRTITEIAVELLSLSAPPYPPISLPPPSSAAVCHCHTEICVNCGQDSDHRPASCLDVLQWNVYHSNNQHNTQWLLSHTRKCPDCGARIEKNQGCNHLTCRCGGEFCFVCGGDWKQHLEEANNSAAAYRCTRYTSKWGEKTDLREDDKKSKDKSENSQNTIELYHMYYTRVKSLEWDVSVLSNKLNTILIDFQKTFDPTSKQAEYVNLCLGALWLKKVLKWALVHAFNLRIGVGEGNSSLFTFACEALEDNVEKLCYLLFKQGGVDPVQLKRHFNHCIEEAVKFIKAHSL